MKEIAFTAAATKSFRKLPADVQARLRSKLERYSAAGAGDVIAMQGEDSARMRVGDFRILFFETDDTIEVYAIGHRRDIYR